MNDELLFFKIVPRHAIWGGKKIQKYFGYDVPDKTGQIWVFSAQKGEDTICQNGQLKDVGLFKIWNNNPELFNSNRERFPYIISLVAPVDNLSVQVHPTDKVAKDFGYQNGKNEAWVLLHTDPDASLIYGSKVPIPELHDKIDNRYFDGVFNSIKTKAGDFIYIPAGTIHGLGKGNIAYEVQQSTDLTFRIYDYDRREADGSSRELNVKEAIKSIKDTDDKYNTTLDYVHPEPKDLVKNDDVTVHEYISNHAFTITSIKVYGKTTLKKQGYWLTTVCEGEGKVNGTNIKFTDNFIVPATANEVTLEGTFTLMITSENHTVVAG
ncbi:MAG: type I phosphomannose isomerase catalytic subunit [Sporolactobacillus sp.]